MEIRRIPATQLSNPATRDIIYTPPVGEALIREKLANWERFIHEHADNDPLVRMAVAHYQFEAIHPFADGNGRTGRVLNQLILIENNLLQIPVLYLSRHIIRHKADYYARTGVGSMGSLHAEGCAGNRALDDRENRRYPRTDGAHGGLPARTRAQDLYP